jgi:LPXTG-site transpeptidase (sortase) family protein
MRNLNPFQSTLMTSPDFQSDVDPAAWLTTPPTPPLPPRPRRRKVWWIEVAKFVGIFAFFMTVLSLIVMTPTIYQRVSYWFFGPQFESTSDAKLPTNTDNDTGIQAALDVFAGDEFVPAVDTIIIPKIGVNAPIVYMQSRDNAQILEDIKRGVGHYPDTALPGRVGNTFLTGHSSYYWWSDGQYKQVFALLDQLTIGDLVYIYYQGDRYVYRINHSQVVLPAQVEVLAQGTEPTLTLMTCTPLGTSWKRLIVSADLVGRPPVDLDALRDFGQLPPLPTILPLY